MYTLERIKAQYKQWSPYAAVQNHPNLDFQ